MSFLSEELRARRRSLGLGMEHRALVIMDSATQHSTYKYQKIRDIWCSQNNAVLWWHFGIGSLLCSSGSSSLYSDNIYLYIYFDLGRAIIFIFCFSIYWGIRCGPRRLRCLRGPERRLASILALAGARIQSGCGRVGRQPRSEASFRPTSDVSAISTFHQAACLKKSVYMYIYITLAFGINQFKCKDVYMYIYIILSLYHIYVLVYVCLNMYI